MVISLCEKEAEKVIANIDLELSYWWSGLMDVEDNCNWVWQHSKIRSI